jgi:hypothetical protein
MKKIRQGTQCKASLQGLPKVTLRVRISVRSKKPATNQKMPRTIQTFLECLDGTESGSFLGTAQPTQNLGKSLYSLVPKFAALRGSFSLVPKFAALHRSL